jgi:hypothetical protein
MSGLLKLMLGMKGASWSPTDLGNSLVYFLDPANISTMKKENATTGAPNTAVTVDADPIGLIYDRGYHGFFATAQSDATRPILGSDANMLSFITFNGTSQRLTVPNTQKYLKLIQDAGSNPYCFMFWIKINAADGTNCVIADNSEFSTTANSGFSIYRSTLNKLVFKVNYSSGGNYKVNKSTTADLKASNGWTPVIIYSEGNGTNKLHIQIGNAAEELANVGAVGTTNDCFTNMFIGCNSNVSSFGSFSLGPFDMMNRIPTAEEIVNFKSYNPPRNSRSWVVNTQEYNFNNSSKGFADLAKTIPITNGVAIRAWEPEVASIFGPLNRDLTTASAGVSPIWTTNLQNGKAGLVFDGIDDNIGAASSFFRERCGMGVLLLVAKNTRAALGSHFLFGSNYLVGTGSTYPGGILGVGNTYFTAHPAAGPGIGPSEFKNKVESTNVMVVRRNGSTWSQWTGTKIETPGVDSNIFIMTSMGAAAIVGWELQGAVFKVSFYSGTKSNAIIESMIDAENSSYNI